MEEVIDHAARKLTVYALAYYWFNCPLVEDDEYDRLSGLVADHWDLLSPQFQDTLGLPEDIRATGYHFFASRQAFQSTLKALRDLGVDEDLGAPGWSPEVQWIGPAGEEVELMSVSR